MLNVISFTFNAFDENTYLLTNEENKCWFVDPGMYYEDERGMLDKYIQQKSLSPQGIINTHCHIDHIFGAQYLMDKYNITFRAHELEQQVLKMARGSAAIFGFDFDAVPAVSAYIKEGSTLNLGKDTLEVRHVPGHSPGSIAFYCKAGNWVLSGDVLFQGGVGRSDLPGGDHTTLLNSIRTQLFTLPGNTKVLSGHGPETVIEREKQFNPFLRTN